MPHSHSQNALSFLHENFPSPISLGPRNRASKTLASNGKQRGKNGRLLTAPKKKPEIPTLKYNTTSLEKTPKGSSKSAPSQMIQTTKAPPLHTEGIPSEPLSTVFAETAPSTLPGNFDERVKVPPAFQLPPLSQTHETFSGKFDRFQSQPNTSQCSPPHNADAMEINKKLIQASHDLGKLVGYVEGSHQSTNHFRQDIFEQMKTQQKLMEQIFSAIERSKRLKKGRRAVKPQQETRAVSKQILVRKRKNSVYLCASTKASSWKRWLGPIEEGDGW